MHLTWTQEGSDDYQYWQKADERVAEKIRNLIRDIRENDPYKGLGKPEPLKYNLKGWWSRRITIDDRLVYRVSGRRGEQVLEIASCRYHY